jgi:hypothetical protein
MTAVLVKPLYQNEIDPLRARDPIGVEVACNHVRLRG